MLEGDHGRRGHVAGRGASGEGRYLERERERERDKEYTVQERGTERASSARREQVHNGKYIFSRCQGVCVDRLVRWAHQASCMAGREVECARAK